MQMLGGRGSAGAAAGGGERFADAPRAEVHESSTGGAAAGAGASRDEFDDDIPF